MRKTLKFFLSLIIAVNVLLVAPNPVLSQDEFFVKEAQRVPPGEIHPGDNVFVQIRFPGNTNIVRNPADIMLVMDRSGSMGWRWDGIATCTPTDCKITSAKKAMKAFVDQTQEDTPTSPGDYVGLASYSSTASLNFPISNMTADRKANLEDGCTAWGCGIDSLTPESSTSIGGGMQVAIQELLNQREPKSSTRVGVSKYMVLATDGKQNTDPNPFSLYSGTAKTILQMAIDNEITIFTVGIGNDVRNAYDYRCPICTSTTPDLNGNGIKDGEDLMMYIANETGGEYYFAPNDDGLKNIYKEIAVEIHSDYWYRVLDMLNPQVDLEGDPLFTGFVPADPPTQVGNFSVPYVFSITDCTNASFPDTGPALPAEQIGGLMITGDGKAFTVLLKNVGAGDVVCVNFQVHTNENWSGPTDSYSVDNPNIRRVMVWDPEDHRCDVITGLCLILFKPIPNNIGAGWIKVVNPTEPWLKTTGGDVGSRGKIGDIKADHLAALSLYNADYLVISQGTISPNFRSKQWLVPSYPNLTIPPLPTTGIYNALQSQYKGCRETLDQSRPSDIQDKINQTGCNILFKSGDFTVEGTWGDHNPYVGRPAIIFVEGNLVVNNNLRVGQDTGLIFVTQGNITINSNVTQIDGIFIANGNFNTGGSGSSDQQLIINGAVYAFGQASFTRGLANNRDTPAELVNYEPRYLWLFREIAGSAPIIYREVVP